MKSFIAYCGLDCEVCEARIATVNDDIVLLKSVANQWSEMNHVEITSEMINCSGCRIDGPKTPYSGSICPIRQCAVGKKYKTCGNCDEMANCEKLAMITGNNTDALSNLKIHKD